MKTANIMFIVLLAFIFVQQINPAEVGWTRYYLESDKTRIVFFLDEIPQYKTHYNQEDNTISIILSDSHLGKPSKKFNVNGKFVDSILLKQSDIDTVDIRISLPKPANYKVFDIKSPALIIVDITSIENAIKPATSAITQEKQISRLDKINENEQINELSKVNATKIDTPIKTNEAEKKLNNVDQENVTDASAQLSIMSLQWQALKSLNGSALTILQYIFDLLILSGFIYMIIKIKSIDKLAKYIRRNRRKLKNNPIFADILNEIEKDRKRNYENMVKENSEEKEKTSKKTKSEDTKDNNEDNTIKQYDKVQELAQKGIDPISISQKSNIPVGEVNLILDLIRARKDS